MVENKLVLLGKSWFCRFLGGQHVCWYPGLVFLREDPCAWGTPQRQYEHSKKPTTKGQNKHHHIAAIYPIYELQNCKLMMYERYVYVDMYIYPRFTTFTSLKLVLNIPGMWSIHKPDSGPLGDKPSQSTSPHWRRAMSVWSNLSKWFPDENDPQTELTFWVHMGIRFVGQISWPRKQGLKIYRQSPSKNIVQHQKRSKTKQTWLLIDW